MKLAAYTRGRDNNLHLMRIVAAYAVLVSHSFVLATGEGENEPFVRSLGVTLGSIAVDVFFLASGLLVTGSLLAKRQLGEFAWARALRIFPALLVMLVITVFLMGPALSSLPVVAYLLDPATYQYLFKSATLVTGMGKSLPGVFEHNPFPEAVNGSLWTLKYEIRMYAILGLGWWVIHRFAGSQADRCFKWAIVLAACVSGGQHVLSCMGVLPYRQAVQLFFMFFTGASCFVLRHRIALSGRVCWALVGGLAACALAGKGFQALYALAVPYLTFYLAYVPAGRIRAYNRAGDYSYGIYIYAFPVQQAIAACVPGVGVWAMVAGSSLLVLPLAMLSWHLVEERAMALRARLIKRPTLQNAP